VRHQLGGIFGIEVVSRKEYVPLGTDKRSGESVRGEVCAGRWDELFERVAERGYGGCWPVDGCSVLRHASVEERQHGEE